MSACASGADSILRARTLGATEAHVLTLESGFSQSLEARLRGAGTYIASAARVWVLTNERAGSESPPPGAGYRESPLQVLREENCEPPRRSSFPSWLAPSLARDRCGSGEQSIQGGPRPHAHHRPSEG